MNAKPNANEIVKALRCEATSNAGECPIEECGPGCPYYDSRTYALDTLISESAPLIESQAAELDEKYILIGQQAREMERREGIINSLRAQLAASQRRERAAVTDLTLAAKEMQAGVGPCVVCKHFLPFDESHGLPEICRECAGGDKCFFEWRGPQEAGSQEGEAE